MSSGVEKSSSELIFTADLGGTYLRAATVDATSKIHHRLKQATPQAEKPYAIVRALVSAARDCLA
jgi:predicted NBD/HSP70 family sugar kinase